MSPRNKIYGFPPAIRKMINRRLYQQGFQGYEEMAQQITALGYSVSRSALHRYGQELEAKVEKAGMNSFLKELRTMKHE